MAIDSTNPWFALLISLTLSACLSSPRPLDDSAVHGNIPSFMGGRLKPLPLSQLEKVAQDLAKDLTIAAKSAKNGGRVRRQDLKEFFLKHLALTGGLPRWQARSLLYQLIDSDVRLCNQASCAAILAVKRGDIEGFLDQLREEVKTDSRLTDRPQLASVRAVLEKSLEPEFAKMTPGSPKDVVQFKSAAVTAAVARALPKIQSPTYEDLEQITSLNLRFDWDEAPRLEEITLFSKIKRLQIAVWKPEHLAAVLPYVYLVDELEFFRPFSNQAPELTVEHLEPFGAFSHIRSVSLGGVRISRPDLLAKTFRYARSLSVTNFQRFTDQINNGFLQSVSQMPHLRKLSLDVATTEVIQGWTQVLPESIREIRISIGSRAGQSHCGGLGLFEVFRHAKDVTIIGCPMTGLGPFKQPLAWEILKLDRPTNAQDPCIPLTLKLPPELRNLIVFSSNARLVTLDVISQHELADRLARATPRASK